MRHGGPLPRRTGGAALAHLLDRVGLPPGAHAVELGCGPRGNLVLLAQRVGPQGRVVGVERRPEAVGRARRATLDNGAVVEVRHCDARSTGLPRRAFDLVAATMILFITPRPEEVVAEAVALARPGGLVVFQEGDIVAHTCDPPLAAWERLLEALHHHARQRAIDVHVGRRLPRLLRGAGLVDVHVEARTRIQHPGNDRRSGLPALIDALGDELAGPLIPTRSELAELRAALEQHLADSDTTVYSPMYVQAWGRAPSP